MKFKRCIIILCVLILQLGYIKVNAEPYQNYTYDATGNAQKEPQAYIPSEIITGKSVGTTQFKEPSDIFVQEKLGKIYISDTGNNRVVVVDMNFKLLYEIKEFINNGNIDIFSSPRGIFVTEKGLLYVTDSKNQRIVVIDNDNKLVRIIGKPKSNLISSDFLYIPNSVVVDSANRIFIVAENTNQGIVELDEKGEFSGFFGPITVQTKLDDVFWSLFMTKDQRDKKNKVVPTEYSNITIDNEDFIYGIVSAMDFKSYNPNNVIRRLNPMGVDVLKRLGFFPPMGDLLNDKIVNAQEQGFSKFTDIAVLENGVYSTLDKTRGRVFTYNANGELMYVFGGKGTDFGQFGTPCAIEKYQGIKYLVLDKEYNQIILFEPTNYAKLILDAVKQYNDRDLEKANKAWLETSKYTSKSSLAYKGIGESLLREKKFKDAMYYSKISNDKASYSVAFYKYRKQIIEKYLKIILTLIVITTVVFMIISLYRKTTKSKREGRR